MKMKMTMLDRGLSTRAVLAGLTAAFVAAVACNSGSDSPTAPGGGGPTLPTITITSDGVNPRELPISVGSRVRIVNNDSRPRELQSNPHDVDADGNPVANPHSDCPPMNQGGVIQPGQSGTTGVFNEVRACGYHDHATGNEDSRFRGQVVVGGAPPAEPDY